MKNFIRNIKNHWKLALVCLAVLVVIVVITVLVVRSGGSKPPDGSSSGTEPNASSDTVGYFENSDYPVRTLRQDNDLIITLQGTDWEYSCQPLDKLYISLESTDDGTSVYKAAPVDLGYATVTFKKTASLGELSYDTVNIQAEVVVFEEADETLSVRLSDIRENTSASGAMESETPYLLQDNRVIMPNGGDWTLTVSGEGNVPEELYRIMPGVSDEGYSYFDVTKNPGLLIDENGEINEELANTKLVLSSESLGIEVTLECIMNTEREWILVEAAAQ